MAKRTGWNNLSAFGTFKWPPGLTNGSNLERNLPPSLLVILQSAVSGAVTKGWQGGTCLRSVFGFAKVQWCDLSPSCRYVPQLSIPPDMHRKGYDLSPWAGISVGGKLGVVF